MGLVGQVAQGYPSEIEKRIVNKTGSKILISHLLKDDSENELVRYIHFLKVVYETGKETSSYAATGGGHNGQFVICPPPST